MSNSGSIGLKNDFPSGGIMAWLVCLSAGLFFFYEFFQLNLFDVINQSLRDDFNIDAGQLSWMSSSYVWANTVFLIPAGIILDRFSVRHVLLTATMTCIVGTIGFGLSHSFFLACLFRFLMGIGNAFCFLSCVVLAARWFPPRRQALVIGCLVTMAFFGGMMAHTPMVYLNEHFGWRHALLIDGTAGLLLFAWLLIIIKNYPNHQAAQAHHSSQSISRLFIEALQNRQNWLSGLYIACLNLPIMVLGALWGASYLSTVHHLSNISASNVVSCLFVGSMIGCPLTGWISDAVGKRKLPMLIGAILTLLVFLPLFLCETLTSASLGLIFFLIGLVTSTQVIGYPCIAESNKSQNTGAATGLASVIIMGGGGIGQVVFGQLVQLHAGITSQHYNVVDYQFALWMFPATVVVALLAIVFIRETYCNRIH